MSQRSLYMAYLKGWRHAAGGHETDPKFFVRLDPCIKNAYAAGYTDGQKAHRDASASASKMYGYTPTILRAMKTV